MGIISQYIKDHFRHFNSAAVVDASEAYVQHIDSGGKMMVTLAGAMSTAELGKSLSEMIRQGKVHAITCTGANLEAVNRCLISWADIKIPTVLGKPSTYIASHLSSPPSSLVRSITNTSIGTQLDLPHRSHLQQVPQPSPKNMIT